MTRTPEQARAHTTRLRQAATTREEDMENDLPFQGVLPCLSCGGPPTPGRYACPECLGAIQERVCGALAAGARRLLGTRAETRWREGR